MKMLQWFKSVKILQKMKRKISHLDSLDLVRYGYPVDFQECHNHRKAHLINKSIVHDLDERVICQCCGRTVGSQPIKSLCYDNNIFAKYGPGIPLYFQFFQFVIYLVVIYFCVYGIYGILSNFMSSDCHKYKHCWNDNFGMSLSFLNSYEESHVALFQLGLIAFVIGLSIFAFLFIRYKLKAKKQLFDDFLISPSDFSIILRRLPKSTTQKDIQKTIDNFRNDLSDEQKIATNNLKIHKIVFAYNLTEYLQIEKKNFQNFKQSCMQDSMFSKVDPPNIEQKLSTAVVIFQKQASKLFFTGYLSCIEQLKRSHWLGHQPLSSLVQVRGEYVNVERAPQPDDIIWVNQGLSVKELQIRRLVVLSFSISLLVVSAGLQYALAKWRMTFSLKDETTQRLFSLGLACFITIINYLITTLLVLSTKFQKPRTFTLQKISLIFKLVMMQFLNSGTISIVITSAMEDFKFYKTVICVDMLYIMIMNVVVNNIMNFLMVTLEIPSWLDRVLLYFRVESYTQKEANKIFEANEVDLQYKYAYIFKTLWLTAFFMPAQPIVVLLSILALLINYWSQKYLFSGFYSIPYMFSGRISISVLDLLNYTCLWLVLGSFFIHLLRVNFYFRLMPTEYVVFHGIGLILSIFIIYAPLSNLSKQIFGETEAQNQYHRSYQVEKQFFQITYQGSNPAYRKGRKFKRKFDTLAKKLAQAFQ